MDLSILMGGGKYLKRLQQLETKTNWSNAALANNTWVEALSLTGQHLIEMVAARGDNAVDCHVKYEVDGVMSTERVIVNQNYHLIIGVGNSTSSIAEYDDIYMDTPQFCKESFRLYVKKGTNATSGMGITSRYSQVAVEDMG